MITGRKEVQTITDRHKAGVSREKTEQVRHRILEVAEQLFLEYGFRAVSTRQIAQECGLRQPNLYYYFKDKEEIYIALMETLLQRTRQHLETALAEPGYSLEERFIEVVYQLISTSPPNYNILFHDLNHELQPASQARIGEVFFQCVLHPLIRLHEQGVQAGFIRDFSGQGLHPITATNLLLSLIEGFKEPFEQEKDLRPALTNRELARLLVHIHLYGFASQRPG